MMASSAPYLRICHHELAGTFTINPPAQSFHLSRPLPKSLHLRRPRRSPRVSKTSTVRSSAAMDSPAPSSTSAAAAAAAAAEKKPFSVLFVCLGNICRSPAAEGVFRNLVKTRGLDSEFVIDSAGTIGYHEILKIGFFFGGIELKGNKADPRMRSAGRNRGVEITSISRPIRPSDFREFDLILPMDLQNRDDIIAAYERWSFKEPLPKDAEKKVKLMCSYCKKHKETEVPDPYYGGQQGFEKVLDLLEDACESLLDSILSEKGQASTQ
ncbi:hypothetical protein QJS10_CPA08g01545 [Acorus calamus]|uniref:Phosphotyrosine protein phosphatase I domain-containing protein n=1 Tax=Acorus calamus TaxID=4465 RepID=A0AAV9EBR3_ACOCL|nr:hypothetical protein QJS10_CPA08g01545 [Acorus calamus]